jgi:hypothetical protein
MPNLWQQCPVIGSKSRCVSPLSAAIAKDFEREHPGCRNAHPFSELLKETEWALLL